MKTIFSMLIGPVLLGSWVATDWSPALWIFNGLVGFGTLAVLFATYSLDRMPVQKLNEVLIAYRRTSSVCLMYTFMYQIGVMVFLYSYDLRNSLILFVLSAITFWWFNSAVYSLNRRAEF